MIQVRGSFAQDLLAKYALFHWKKNSRAFSLSLDDKKYMESLFESSSAKDESHMYISIFEYFLSNVEFGDIPLEHRVASVAMFLYEILRYFRNGRRSAMLELRLGSFMVQMSATHRIKFISHK